MIPTELVVDDQVVADQVHAEMARVFNDRLVASAFISPLGIGFLAWLQVAAVGLHQAAVWTALMVSAELLVIGVGRGLRRALQQGGTVALWLRAQWVCCGWVGVVWGAATWFVWSPDQFLYYITTLCAVVGVSFSAIVVMTPMRWATRAFLAGLTLVPLVQLATIDNPIGLEIGVGWVIMVAIQLWYAANLRGELTQQIDSSVRNGMLVQRLQQVGQQLAQANTDLNTAMDQLTQLLTFDQLTGAYSRRHVMEALDRQLAQTLRHGAPVSLVMLDLDHFKHINDQYGHSAGDRALRETAAQVQAQLREGDLLGRIGGEEFLVLLPMTGAEPATQLAERLRATLAQVRLEEGAQTIAFTGSFGVAELQQHEDVSAWLRRADLALYQAKTLGRNRVVVAP